MRKIMALFMSMLCVCLLLLRIPVDAASGQNRLTLHYYATNEALPLAGATFCLYRVGAPDGNGGYELCEDFSRYQVDISDLDWNEAGRLTMLAITLSAYAERDGIVPPDTKMTDLRGDLTFEDLTDGLYLVCGDVLTVEVGDTEWNFTPQPLLVPLPYPNTENSGLSDMEIDVKYDRFPPPTMDDLIDLTVIKVWEGGEEQHDTVTAQLMRNGIVTDSAELNEANNWQYTWENLNSGYIWQIVEENVPEGYTVSVHQEGYVFTVINTINTKSDTEITTTQPNTDVTTASTTGVTVSTVDAATTATVTSNNSSGSTKLPQTGQLWWPVPILLSAAVVLFGAGLILCRDEKREKYGKTEN